MRKQEIIEIERVASKFFIGASGCHDWSHVERVKFLALNIGKKEKANLKIIEVAALLHDIGRKDEMKNKGFFCHAECGAEMAKKILAKYSFENEDIKAIVHCIGTHRYRKGSAPETIEAKVLFDADKLDSIGAVGIGRDFLFAGSVGSNTLYTGNEKKLARSRKDYSYTKEDSAVLEYEIKLKHIKNKILTKAGKKMAKERHEFMEKFFRRFYLEVKGKK